MATFGEMLRSEREEHGLSIEQVSWILEVDQERLRALERNDFAALPDEQIMTECLRAYAECLHVEADLMIEDYTRERDRCLQQLAAAIPERPIEIEPGATPPRVRGRRRPGLLVASLCATIAVAGGAWWLLSGDLPANELPGSEPAARPPARPLPAPSAPVETPRAEVADPTRDGGGAATSAALRISDHGVGSGIRERQLVGRGRRFAEGSQVWFWTQVEGGERGDRIDHVWLREGVEVARIPLSVGGSRWRTQSNKTLRAAAAGAWAVEARDVAGRVLARDEFVCVP